MDASMTHASSVTSAASARLGPQPRVAPRRSAAALRAQGAATLVALLLLVAGVSGCAKLQARDLLNKGVGNYKNGLYDAAIDDFQKAKQLDPRLMNDPDHLYHPLHSQYTRLSGCTRIHP